MATDVLLGGFLLTREEWDAMNDDERLMLVHAAVEPSASEGRPVAPPEYESYELLTGKRAPEEERTPEKLAS